MNNPIITREILTHLRMPNRFFSLMSLLLFSAVVFCIAYAFVKDQGADLSEGGRNIFFPMVYVAMLIGIPIATMSASSIVREREEETLDLMMTTPMSHTAIIGGKVLATLLYSLFFLMAMLPFFYFSSIAGGISWEEMTQCMVVLIGFYCSVAMMGTFISLISVSSNIAGRYAITILLFIYLGPSVFGAMIAAVTGYNYWVILLMALSTLINPFYAILMIQLPNSMPNASLLPGQETGFSQETFERLVTFYVTNSGYITGISNLIFALLLFILTCMIFRVFSSRLSTKFTYANMLGGINLFKRKPKPQETNEKSSETSYREPVFSDNNYVVFQKERLLLNRKFLSNERNILIGALFVTAALTWFALYKIIPEVDKIPAEFLYYMLCVFCTVIVVLFSPVTPSYSVMVEYQKDTWDLLRTTLIKSPHIIQGKILNGFLQASLPLLGITISFLLTFLAISQVFHLQNSWGYLLQCFFVLVFFSACMFFYCSVAVLYSTKAKKKRFSPHRNTFIVILFHFLAPFLFYLMAFCFIYFVLRTRSDNAVIQLVAFFEKNVFVLSPIYVFIEPDWGFGNYVFFLMYSGAMIFLGIIISYAASSEIKKQS